MKNKLNDLAPYRRKTAWKELYGPEDGERISAEAEAHFDRVESAYRSLLGQVANGLVGPLSAVLDEVVADLALKESESHYRSMVETAAECISIHALDGRIVFANLRMAAMLGTTVEALQRGTIFDLIAESDRPIAASKLRLRHRVWNLRLPAIEQALP